MKFADIKPFTSWGHYQVDVSVRYLQNTLDDYVKDYNLDMNPDFQREHVWNETQQIRYLEFFFKGGRTGRDILFNCPNFTHGNPRGKMVLVDGKQRLEAFQRFFANEIVIFGGKLSEYTDKPDFTTTLRFFVNDLPTRMEVLQWYVDLNAGGTVHTTDEINRVRTMIGLEMKEEEGICEAVRRKQREGGFLFSAGLLPIKPIGESLPPKKPKPPTGRKAGW